MRILLLHKYGRRAASFRHRFEQYVPYLERAGFDCTVSSLLDDSYLEPRMSTGEQKLGSIVRGYVRTLGLIADARTYDLVVIGVEALPYVPAFVERYLVARNIPYVFDFDDPIFHTYDRSPNPVVRALLGRKIQTVARHAAHVFAGSPYLVQYVRAVNASVEYLPTVIDLDRYAQTRDFGRAASGPFTIGWIGSPSTAHYLDGIAPALRRVCARHDARVVLVGSGGAPTDGIPTEIRPWDEARESADLLEFDAGIMPLTDDPWSRGKCGFKLVQYMASGLPVIASPVGVNREMVQPGVNGFLASDTSEWEHALERLVTDRATCARLGAAGRARVVREYCVQATAPRFVEGIRHSLRASRRAR